jgi:nicotinate dehydrogenase subunit A
VADPAERAVALTLNGRAVAPVVDPETPLIHVLRGALGVVSVRFGCGEEACGVCTVLVDGQPAYACSTPVWAVEGKAVETVEALPDDDPLIAAFAAERAGQCGYCLSGIVMRATALLRATPQPDRAAAAAALSPSLCRCGAHPRILNAVLRAAEGGPR